MIRLFIVADVRLYREGLAHCLATDYDVVGTAAGGGEALEAVAGLSPDVVLIDVATPDSLRTIRVLAEVAPRSKVLALAVPETEQHVIRCAEAGMAGYVSRDASVADLVSAIRNVACGETVLSPQMTASLLRRVAVLAAERPPERQRQELTLRELEIVDLIDQGLSNKQIARRLVIEEATVKNHVHNLLGKLGVHRRAEAAAIVRRSAAGLALRARSGRFSVPS
jgi:two-component system, NarL family, nitrate/nitrite response regulator NarL